MVRAARGGLTLARALDRWPAPQRRRAERRVYPPTLAGPGYATGIPIAGEEEHSDLLQREEVDEAVFAYSDVTHEHVMHVGSIALAAGADFVLLGPRTTELQSSKPVVAI